MKKALQCPLGHTFREPVFKKKKVTAGCIMIDLREFKAAFLEQDLNIPLVNWKPRVAFQARVCPRCGIIFMPTGDIQKVVQYFKRELEDLLKRK